jgi:polar amino acid transport system permease protein
MDVQIARDMAPGGGPGEPDAATALAQPRPGRWLAAAAALVALAMAGHALIANPAFQWGVVRDFFAAGPIVRGLVTTLWLTAVSLVAGYLLGLVLAVMRLSGNPVLTALSWGYVWLFRSVPMLVQLLFWYNVALLYPRLSLGVPFGPELFHFRTEHLIGGTAAAVIGLSLHEAGQAAEIIRGGLLSVPSGQTQAAQALGLSRARVLRRIVLPQAMRAILPPTGNQVIALLKGTAIVSVIAVQDLLFAAQLIYNRNYLVIPLLLVATVWYLLLTTVLSAAQQRLERHFGEGRPG